MSKGTATITFPDGTSYTRKTDSAYAFGIAYTFDEVGQIERQIAYCKETIAQLTSQIESGHDPRAYFPNEGEEITRFDGSKTRLGVTRPGPLTAECRADKERRIQYLEKEIAKFSKKLAKASTERWACEQMSSRRDLAEKALAQYGGSKYARDGKAAAIILPVVFVPAKGTK